VDDVDGDLHRALDPKPDAAYLMDTDGNVAFRTVSSSNARVLREGLRATVARRPLAARERQPRVVPLLKGLGSMHEVLGLAGEEARRDLRKELPPVYLLARLAALLGPLPPLWRRIAAVAVAAAVSTAVLGGFGRLGPRSRPGG